jgi:hypothetical protein
MLKCRKSPRAGGIGEEDLTLRYMPSEYPKLDMFSYKFTYVPT